MVSSVRVRQRVCERPLRARWMTRRVVAVAVVGAEDAGLSRSVGEPRSHLRPHRGRKRRRGARQRLAPELGMPSSAVRSLQAAVCALASRRAQAANSVTSRGVSVARAPDRTPSIARRPTRASDIPPRRLGDSYRDWLARLSIVSACAPRRTGRPSHVAVHRTNPEERERRHTLGRPVQWVRST